MKKSTNESSTNSPRKVRSSTSANFPNIENIHNDNGAENFAIGDIHSQEERAAENLLHNDFHMADSINGAEPCASDYRLIRPPPLRSSLSQFPNREQAHNRSYQINPVEQCTTSTGGQLDRDPSPGGYYLFPPKKFSDREQSHNAEKEDKPLDLSGFGSKEPHNEAQRSNCFDLNEPRNEQMNVHEPETNPWLEYATWSRAKEQARKAPFPMSHSFRRTTSNSEHDCSAPGLALLERKQAYNAASQINQFPASDLVSNTERRNSASSLDMVPDPANREQANYVPQQMYQEYLNREHPNPTNMDERYAGQTNVVSSLSMASSNMEQVNDPFQQVYQAYLNRVQENNIAPQMHPNLSELNAGRINSPSSQGMALAPAQWEQANYVPQQMYQEYLNREQQLNVAAQMHPNPSERNAGQINSALSQGMVLAPAQWEQANYVPQQMYQEYLNREQQLNVAAQMHPNPSERNAGQINSALSQGMVLAPAQWEQANYVPQQMYQEYLNREQQLNVAAQMHPNPSERNAGQINSALSQGMVLAPAQWEQANYVPQQMYQEYLNREQQLNVAAQMHPNPSERINWASSQGMALAPAQWEQTNNMGMQNNAQFPDANSAYMEHLSNDATRLYNSDTRTLQGPNEHTTPLTYQMGLVSGVPSAQAATMPHGVYTYPSFSSWGRVPPGRRLLDFETVVVTHPIPGTNLNVFHVYFHRVKIECPSCRNTFQI